MTGALLVAALGAVALGGVLAAFSATFATGLVVQAAGAAGIAVAGFSVLGSGSNLGAGFASSFAPGFGVDGLSGLFLGTLGALGFVAFFEYMDSRIKSPEEMRARHTNLE